MADATKRIIIDYGDGTINVLFPSPNVVNTVEELADMYNEGFPAEVVDAADMPEEPFFRYAWKAGAGGGVEVDMTRAVEVAHVRRREVRDKRFEPLDREASRPGQAGAAAEAARQAIRDEDAAVQALLDSSADPQQLMQRMVENGLFES